MANDKSPDNKDSKASQQKTASSGTDQTTRIMFVHGDKGGVGKTQIARLVADFLNTIGSKCAIVEADTSNPDVKRMFEGRVPTQAIDLREEDGWDELMSFCNKHKDCHIIINLPGGIGSKLHQNLAFFNNYIQSQPNIVPELWWSLTRNHDAINLLDNALNLYGTFFKKVYVVRNLWWSNGSPNGWTMWDESPVRHKIEIMGGKTITLHPLHEKTYLKLFNDPLNLLPFSEALDTALGESLSLDVPERFRLVDYLKQNSGWLSETFGVSQAIWKF